MIVPMILSSNADQEIKAYQKFGVERLACLSKPNTAFSAHRLYLASDATTATDRRSPLFSNTTVLVTVDPFYKVV